MPEMPIVPFYRLLIVENNEAEAERLRAMLGGLADCHVAIDHVTTLAAAGIALARRLFDGIIADLALPDSTGIATLRQILAWSDGAPVILASRLHENPALRPLAAAEGAVYVLDKAESPPPWPCYKALIYLILLAS
jgi:CheY-like chemotaxis protein